MSHQPADCDRIHDEQTDTTRCYPLDDDHAAVAQILGHDVHRRGHVRLTPAQRGQIAELVALWKRGDAR